MRRASRRRPGAQTQRLRVSELLGSGGRQLPQAKDCSCAFIVRLDHIIELARLEEPEVLDEVENGLDLDQRATRDSTPRGVCGVWPSSRTCCALDLDDLISTRANAYVAYRGSR